MSCIVGLTVMLEDFMAKQRNLDRPVIRSDLRHEVSRKLIVGELRGGPASQTSYRGMSEDVGAPVAARCHTWFEGAPIDERPVEIFLVGAVVRKAHSGVPLSALAHPRLEPRLG